MYDVVIIGSGAAGLSTALNISKNLKVLILTASKLEGANTKLAQGGIAASWRASDEEHKLHVLDTNKAGCFLNDEQAVEQLISDSDQAIDFLIESGTDFDKLGANYDLTAEGAHSCRRIFHADGDSTGRVIYEALIAKVEQSANITIFDNSIVTQVSEHSPQKYVVYFEHAVNNLSITTENLVIACGGYGNLFRATTNTEYINGCSLIIAKQLELELANLHLIQFHPTGFQDKFGKYHLLTESLRGEGARFYSPQSGYFMEDYHILGDIAPRDVASRAVHGELKKGHDVFLDCTPIASKTDVHTRFQTVSRAVAISDYDLATDLIPICPVAHYSIGGIAIDLDGRTSKPGIYAVGEAAMSGVHGANRLASNSLLECVVYGIRVGNQITASDKFPIVIEEYPQASNLECLEQVQSVLTKYCNIVRSDDDLRAGYKILDELPIVNSQIVDVAKDILESCIKNDSIGCHYKENCE